DLGRAGDAGGRRAGAEITNGEGDVHLAGPGRVDHAARPRLLQLPRIERRKPPGPAVVDVERTHLPWTGDGPVDLEQDAVGRRGKGNGLWFLGFLGGIVS